MPENTKENDPQPSRPVEADLDFRTRLATSSDACEHKLLEKFARKLGKPITQAAGETMSRLCAYAWPGTIRELQNVVERAVVLSKGPVLTVEGAVLLDFPRSDGQTNSASRTPAQSPSGAPVTSRFRSLEEVERQHIIAVLKETNWRIEGKRGAAKLLNLQPSTLRSRMQKLGIVRNPD